MEAMLDGLNAAIGVPEAPVYPVAARDDYVAAMRNAAASVTVVTTDGPAGRFGLTVSAMTSVSADPPMLLVCVNGASPAAAAIAANRVFCVSLLGEGHAPVSDIFSGRLQAEDRFAGAGAWDGLATGAPALADAPSVFDCRVVEVHPFGSHRMFVGLVVAVRAGTGAPLVYHDRAYCRAARVG